MITATQPENDVFEAISHPARRRMLDLLAEGERPVNAVATEFAMSRPAVSQHLAVLKRAGLVIDRREGRQVHYRVEPLGMKPLIDWVAHYRAFWVEHVDRLEQLLDRMEG